ncbi:transposase [Nocardia sp. NPDC005998]|uniref:transposase n=1 Tax=Nocardia sp. NPDC005998 TaxID=3156894 RepID=UPI0033B62E30
MVEHAGLAPREKLSGTFTGRTRLTGQGRSSLRLAAWRAVWGAWRSQPFVHVLGNSRMTSGRWLGLAAGSRRRLHAPRRSLVGRVR